MSELNEPANGTVAEEAARLIEAMVLLARPGAGPGEGLSTHAEPAEPAAAETSPGPDGHHAPGPDGHHAPGPDGHHAPGPAGHHQPTNGVCSACGGQRDSTPVACKLCPVCQGIALLRSVRPETVDRLADFASAVASTLRDLATQSRASGPGSGPGRAPGGSAGGGRARVQDIHVGDEDQG